MSVENIIDLGQRAMLVTLMAAGPMLLSGLLIGLVISIFQSVTQIQEITLTFIPKIVVVMIAFLITAPLIADLLIVYVQELFATIPQMTR